MSRMLVCFMFLVGLAIWPAGLDAASTGPSMGEPDLVTGTVTGQVVEAGTNRPLASTQVSIVGTGLGGLTDGSGNFSISNVPAGEHQVEVTRLGYQSATQSVTLASGETVTLEFILSQQALGLEEIVVTGTAGQARRREVGNTISQISMGEVREPVMNVDHLLQGRASGIDVAQTSGGIGAGSQIRLRGNVSVSQTNQPLIYVDGVRMPSEQYNRGNSQGDSFFRGANLSQSPLNDINPQDIDRIEVLKGSAASTLYGSEAAAGVIQIFTKRGQEGRARWDMQLDQSVNWMQEFGPSNDPFIGMSPWLSNGRGSRASLSVGGGTGDVSYFVSGAFEDNTGVLPNDREERANVRGNVAFEGLDNVRIEWNSAFTFNELLNTSEGNNAHGIQFNVYRRPNNPVGSDRVEDLNEILNQRIQTNNDRFTTGLTVDWSTTERLSNRLTVGYDRLSSRFLHIRPFGFGLQPEGAISDRAWTSQGLSLDYVGNLNLALTDDLRSRISWGTQFQQNEETEVDAFGRGYPGPGDHVVSNAAVRTAFTSDFRVITGGFFGQALFDFHDRYFLTLGVRVDGNSAFGQDLGLETYPKASLSYVISDEDFWPLDLGEVKLRGAYGLAGRAPGAFDAVRTFQAIGYLGTPAFVPENVGNPNLGPERTEEIEVGFDGSFLNDRLTLDFTYYRQSTTDALFNVTQVPSSGFLGGQLENVGALTNQGIEITLDGRVLERPNLYLDLGGSVYTNQSEITDTGPSTAFTLVEGQPAPVVRGTRVLNPTATAEPELEFDAFFGPNQPTRVLGFNAALGLPRGLELSARGEYQAGHYISDGASYNMVDRGAGAPSCQSAYDLVAYNDPNPNANPNMGQVPALYRVRCYSQNLESGSWIYPADYFKLRALTLTIPLGEFVPRASSAGLTVSARNLWRWTNDEFWSFDPEMSARQLDSLTRNITEHIPAPATFTASLRIGF